MLEAIKNFARITETLATAGQPGEAQIREAAEHGFQVIINLGLADQPYSLADERASVEAAGLAYFHIPIPFENPGEDHFARFLRVMDANAGKKTLLHCAANFRASAFAALYGRARLGWTREESEAVFKKVWEPNAIWSAFFAKASADLERAGG